MYRLINYFIFLTQLLGGIVRADAAFYESHLPPAPSWCAQLKFEKFMNQFSFESTAEGLVQSPKAIKGCIWEVMILNSLPSKNALKTKDHKKFNVVVFEKNCENIAPKSEQSGLLNGLLRHDWYRSNDKEIKDVRLEFKACDCNANKIELRNSKLSKSDPCRMY